MSIPRAEPTAHSKLRADAEHRIKEGSAPPTRGGSTGASALRLLYTLASSQETAADALKLLHELQVHQVELDLQHEQMDATARELAEELARYQGFFEWAPAAYLNVASEGHILEGNPASAALFGLELDDLRGRRLESLVAPASRPVIAELLQGPPGRASQQSREVQCGVGDRSGWCRAVARVDPRGASVLVVLVAAPDRSRN
jgi:PAS domain S-box-containing protein